MTLKEEIIKNIGEDKYEDEYPGMKLTDAEKKIVDETSPKKAKKSVDEKKLIKLVEKLKTEKDTKERRNLKIKIKKLRSKILDGIVT